MSISCGCDYDDDYEWRYTPPDYFEALQTKRSRKCCSCGCTLKPGAEVAKFERSRPPRGDIEEAIYLGDDVPMADWYMCEECGGLFMALSGSGYCISLTKGERMRELVVAVNGGEA